MSESIKIEFYGVPRLTAGAAEWELPCDGPQTLPQILRRLEVAAPQVVPDICQHGELADGVIANLEGEKFLDSDTALKIPCGASVLIMSADAGG